MARILIMDQGAVNRRFVAALLAGRGHRLYQASHAEEALRLARTERPDLILVDVPRLGAEWLELVLNLRSAPELRPARMILRATADVEADARWLAQAVDASFLAKPASPDTLLGAVNACLSAPAAGSPERLLLPGSRLMRSLIERAEQLAVARAALDLEIKKRLRAEEELTRANARLSDQATRDALTGLRNRRYLDESLEREEKRARRIGKPLVIMMVDVDHFKRFNDSYGHAAGDAVLRAVAQYLSSLVRGEDIVARYGGDEFAIVMVEPSRDAVGERAETIRSGAALLEIRFNGERIGPIALSVGVGVFPDHGRSAFDALQAADAALMRSKRAGRGRVVVADGPES